jgi:PHP domain
VTTRGAAGVVGAVHVHSSYSHDGQDTLESLRDRAAAVGIRFVAMTDHAEDFDAARFDEYREACRAASDDRVRLIPGLEFRFAGHRGLHLLACGLEQWAQPATLEDFAATVADAARLTILAHPILTGYRVPRVVCDSIDAIEVWNASYNTRFLPDPRAMMLLHTVQRSRPAVVGVAGLDQHDASNDRRTRVVLTDPRDLSDPLLAIREGRFTNVGRTMSFAANAELPAPTFAALLAARAVFDRVERTHERVIRAWRRRKASDKRR